MIKYRFLFFLYLTVHLSALGQDGGIRTKNLFIEKEKRIDTCSIYPNSFEVYLNDSVLSPSAYSLDYSSALFSLLKPVNRNCVT